MRKRQVIAAAAVTLTLAGCGARPVAGSPTADPQVFGDAQALVRAATTQTEKVKSAKFSMDTALLGQSLTAQGEGRFDGDNSAMQLTMHIGPLDETMRYVNKTLYLQVPDQYRAQVTGGKPWGKVPADSPAAEQLGAAQAQQNDPSQTLQQIQEAGTITRSARETLDGQPVTHYWIDVGFAKALDKFKDTGLSQEDLDKLGAMNLTIPVELWLNSDQLPVQITEDLGGALKAAAAAEGPSSAAPSDLSMKLTMKYSDWGTPVDVQEPPADQVGEAKLPG
ncbi:hypothetical protein [Amycolatopsis sp. GM8]|uniref:hypothetical protein n=1 Tax=Amycolatopsis sp. GM8 TaxID=2896530 RepID=UPI001F433873|nr:hypothetical protein [Amycolatopsis sp. GM8]